MSVRAIPNESPETRDAAGAPGYSRRIWWTAPVLGAALLTLVTRPIETLNMADTLIRRGFVYALVGAAVVRFVGSDSLGRKQRTLEAALIVGLAFVIRRPAAFHLSSEWPLLAVSVLAALWINRPAAHRVRAYVRRCWEGISIGRVIAIGVVISLPGLLLPLARRWDMSGFYDAQQYDRDAHWIATWTVPAGNSFVMPLYQYGMAFFYLVFGHFFYVQQVVNVLMAILTVVLLGLTAWNLFRRKGAVAIAVLVGALLDELHMFLDMTQIENWYVPAIALTVWTASWYWRSPSTRHAAALGLAAGLAFNIRSQGIFYFAVLCIAPWFVTGLTRASRARHSLVAALVVALSLLPWSLRNYVVDGRFTPSSDQGTVALLFNHPQVGFYGLRYDLAPWWTIYGQYERQYPDKSVRFRIMRQEFIRNLKADPARHARAVFWRSLAFYGLLPPGILDPAGPRATDWAVQWRPYVVGRFMALFFLAASLVGIVRRPGRLTAFLALCILGNLGVLFFASQNDRRICYPVLPLHLFLALCAAFPPALVAGDNDTVLGFPRDERTRRGLARLVTGLLVFFGFAYVTFGRFNQWAPLREKAVVVEPTTTIDRSTRPLNRIIRLDLPVRVGERVRLRALVTNEQLPPKNDTDRREVPWFAAHPRRETYYHATVVGPGGTVGVTYFGAMLGSPLREGDLVEIEGVLLVTPKPGGGPLRYYTDWWLKADKVVRLADGAGDE